VKTDDTKPEKTDARVMVSGELIRLKSLVDDWGRVARVIRREFPRLEAGEQEQLLAYVRENAPRLEDALLKGR